MLGEVLAVLVLVLVLVRGLLPFIVFPARRRSSHWLVQRGAWAARADSPVSLLVMCSPFAEFFSKWLQYCTIHTMLLPDAFECSCRMSYHVRRGVPSTTPPGCFMSMLVYFFLKLLQWAGPSVFFPGDSARLIPLTTFSLFTTVAGIRQVSHEAKATLQPATEQSDLVADHMKAEAMNPDDAYFAATSESDVGMAAGCKYLVSPLDDHSQLHHAVPPSYRLRCHGADAHQRWITVRDVWRSDLGVRSCAPRALIQDSCLSLAFARLLTRRYYGLPCAEANDPRARDFVLKELISEEDDYRRAFRVVEVELNFLHDYFHFSEYYHGIDRTYKTSACSASHWSEVSYALHYINGRFWKASIIKWCLDHLERFCLYKHQHWQNNIGQFSLLEDIDRYPGKPLRHSIIGLHDDVKRAVGRALVQSEGRLTNGVSSLERNGVLEMFSWACTQQAPTHEIVLIWHIATSYCEISEPSSRGTNGEYDQVQQRCHFDIASNLSRYCAYLVAFAPKFLPGDGSETTAKLKEVINEAEPLLGRCTSREDKYDKLRSLDVSWETQTVLQRGVKLGRMLEEDVQSSRRRWEVLADLWAEMMLYVAPSDDANQHVEHLARGGEFVTHLWALLSNAGILERDQLHGEGFV